MSESIRKISLPSVATIGAAKMLMGPMLFLEGAFAAPTLHVPITCSIVEENQLLCVGLGNTIH
jgi:hypothetical protein